LQTAATTPAPPDVAAQVREGLDALAAGDVFDQEAAFAEIERLMAPPPR
jgi:hypothetical protein